MGSRPAVRSRALCWLLLVFGGLHSTMASLCQLDSCAELFPRAEDQCATLQAYSRCVRRLSQVCRGDLQFHTHLTVLNRNLASLECPNTDCTAYHSTGDHNYKICALFGDPHLKTFNNSYQTCRIRGAWPLVDNKFLAVQVTNEPVIEGSPATATTTVTIIVRKGGHPCARHRKLYTASSNATSLPAAFEDGSAHTADRGVELRAHDDGLRVELHVRYLGATVVVRLAGGYLGVSVRLPDAVASAATASGRHSGVHLCAAGCPASERLDPREARGHALPLAVAVARCGPRLTDAYLDWCVFDVMTTGSDQFTAAAHAAHEEVLRYDPHSLRNRTSVAADGLLEEDPPAFAAAPASLPPLLLPLLLVAFVAAR